MLLECLFNVSFSEYADVAKVFNPVFITVLGIECAGTVEGVLCHI